MHLLFKLTPAAPLALFLAGCVSPSPKTALPTVQAQLDERSDLSVSWPLTQEDRAKAETAVRDLLASKLTVESAVQIALLNNRALRATFEELGLSQAGLAAAGRLSNPSFDASVRWPHDAPRGPNVEFTLTAPLFESLLLPARKRAAGNQLLQTQYRVSHEVLALVAEVRRAAYEVLAQQELTVRLVVIGAVNDAAADFARRQFEAGNIPQRDLEQLQASAQQTQVDVAKAEAATRAAREQLNRLLGLGHGQTEWTMAEKLPALPARDVLPDNLEASAEEHRLDLAALRAQSELAQAALDLKRRTRLLPGDVNLGLDTERESTGGRLTGPRIGLQLPLFDQGQPEIARLSAALRQAQDRTEALAAEISSEVRAARDLLTASRQAAEFYQNTLLPQRSAILRESLLHYNAMQISAYELLAAKEQQQVTERQSVEALRDYWLARTELERAMGNRLPATPQAAPPDKLAEPAPAEAHHPHSHQ